MDSDHHAIEMEEYPQQETECPTRSQRELQETLYSYLRDNKLELFLKQIAELNKEFLDESLTDDNETYLYVACKKGYDDVVNQLLGKHVEINTLTKDSELSPSRRITPLAVAAYMGHHKIVKKLITKNAQLQITSNNEEAGSALTFVIHGMNQQGTSKDTYRKILRLLLTYNFETEPAADNINHRDEKGMTPLNLAIILNDEFSIKSLLYAGADLYSKDPDGNLPLTSLPPTILENYFDDRIEKSPTSLEVDQVVTFDYSIFKQADRHFSTKGNEMELFYLIEQKPELRTLLKHPLSDSFLHVKWCLIKKYYFCDFLYYLLFYVVSNTYIFQIHHCPSSLTSYNRSQLTDTEINNRTTSIPCEASFLELHLKMATLLLFIVFIFRELSLPIATKQYFRSREFLLAIMMAVAVSVLFAIEPDARVAATINVISSFKFLFLLGKHPRFSLYVEMYKKVTSNFVNFFGMFSILTISFANSFYILFRDETEKYMSSKNETKVVTSNQTIENSKNETKVVTSNQTIQNSINLWPDLKISLIKSIIMMTGEFEASTLPLGENFNYNYVFLLLFIFLVPIVLYNLLNGLAVGDTKAIMKDPEMFAAKSRVDLIRQLEILLYKTPLGFLDRFYCTEMQQTKLTLRSSLKYRIKPDGFRIIGEMPLTIIKRAEQIIEKRNHSQNLSTDVAKKTSSNGGSIDETVHGISDQIHNLKLEVDKKNTEMKVRIDEINAKIADRDEKLLRSVDERNAKLLESVMQAVAHLKQKE